MRKSLWLVGLDLQMNGVSEALGTFSLAAANNLLHESAHSNGAV
jgi:hypothetical protein